MVGVVVSVDWWVWVFVCNDYIGWIELGCGYCVGMLGCCDVGFDFDVGFVGYFYWFGFGFDGDGWCVWVIGCIGCVGSGDWCVG